MLTLLAACASDPPPVALTEVPIEHAPIVLVTLDTTRADRIGAYGHVAARTPNLDALAARGTRFSSAWAPVPLTIPSHSTILTGLLPPRHGVRDNGDHRLSEDATTLAEHFAADGRRTAASVGAFVTQSHWGFGQGFDVYDESLHVASESLSWHVERPANEVVAAADTSADFLWVHLFDAHAPYLPDPAFEDPYDAEIHRLDVALGVLLSTLPADATVVVVGDHGEGFGEGGEDAHGLLLEDGVLRVPLIVAGPGVPVGVVERPVSLADISPTILRLAGLPAPGDLDGRDLFDESERIGVYSETRYGHHHFGWTPLERLTADSSKLVRGARLEGDETLLAELDRLSSLPPAFAAAEATLDPSTVEQLQALGYLSEGGSGAHSGIDPRDGIEQIAKLAALRELPPAEALEAMAVLLAENPGWRDLRMRRGLSLARLGRTDEALAELTDAYRDGPGSTTAVTIGELWLRQGDPAEALGWFLEALTIDPRSATARAGQAQCLAMSGQLDAAQAVIDEGLAETPDHADLLLAGAVLALATHQGEEDWIEAVEDIVARRPTQARLNHVLGSLHLRAGHPEEAEQAFEQELRMQPGNVAARLDLVRLYQEQGRLVDVVKALRPLVALQPEEPVWQAMTASAYLEMGRAGLAKEHLLACAGHPACPE
ncbi:MAG TPA: sulfatase-like hydrolase/transferase [Myxococcota bacterium]|nr:sulfatase-like hydrolase/transferase [Myxococcota bacterium]